MFFSKWFPKKAKRIAFLDGDNPLPQILACHAKYLIGIETHLVRAMGSEHKEPKILKNTQNINKIYLRGMALGKEVTDKFIGAYIQKAIQDGYTEITVVSQDYDFIDIFKMAVLLNPEAAELSFRIIVPILQKGSKLTDMPGHLANISVVRDVELIYT